MSETEETIVAVALGLMVLWLWLTPDGGAGGSGGDAGYVLGPASLPPVASAPASQDPPRVYTTNHAGQVAQAIADLESRGEDLSGPCGAYLIVQETADLIRASGDPAGTLKKPAGNNCDGHSTDIIVYPNGEIYDVLGDGGGANNPQFNDDGFVDPNLYDPG